MGMEEYKTKIKTFLTKYFKSMNFHDDDDIFAMGFVNSMFAMELVMFVENEFEIAIENEDLNIDHFRSVNAIAHLIERKRAMI
jgi:acyl carrier protein